MLPLSNTFMIVFWGSAFFVVSVGLFSTKYWIIRLLPLIGIMIYGNVRFKDNTGIEYEALGDLIAIAYFTVIALIAAIWTTAILRIPLFQWLDEAGGWRRMSRRPAQVLLAVAPALVVCLIALERQYVPEAACSQDSVTLTVGESNFTVPIEFGPRIKRPGLGGTINRVLFYRRDVSRKESLHTICNLTDNGRAPASVDLIWITPAAVSEPLDRLCAGGSERPVCRGHSAGVYSDISTLKVMHDPSKYLAYSLRWFAHDNDPSVNKGGTSSDGYVCVGEDNVPPGVWCNVWRPFGNGATIIAHTRDFTKKTRAELLAAANGAIGYTGSVLSAK